MRGERRGERREERGERRKGSAGCGGRGGRGIVLGVMLMVAALWTQGQDLEYVKGCVKELASPGMSGRSVVDEGDRKASAFLAEEFQKIGLQSFGTSYFQEYPISINTFPGKIRLSVDHHSLKPGRDFLISCNAPGISGTYELVWATNVRSDSILTALSGANGNAFLVAGEQLNYLREMASIPYKGIIFLNKNKLSWKISNGKNLGQWIAIDVNESSFPENGKQITLSFENHFVENYTSRNVIGYIQGKSHPDTFLVFTAHYDHLGRMGKDTYFPGAHDNASGTAMMTDLARHFALPENQPACSMAFMAFSGEEAGLLGSEYYAGHPLFPLEKIRFLINLDLVSTGSDGIMVINGEEFNEEFELLVSLNREENLVKEVKKRGPSNNSDHYPFYRRGVPCFFIHTLGEYSEYHTVDDKPERLPFSAYNEFFTLLTLFVQHLE